MPDRAVYIPILKQYFDEDPSKAAVRLETMPENKAVDILSALPASTAAEVFYRIKTSLQSDFIKKIPPKRLPDLIQKLQPFQAAQIIQDLGQEEGALFLNALPEEIRRDIQELLEYPEGSAGRSMRPDYLSFRVETKVKDVILKLRQRAKTQAPYHSYVYVVDGENKLAGILNMRDLLIADTNAELKDVMKPNVFSVNGFADGEQVASELSRRHYFSVPVVDAENRLIGVIKADNLMEGVQEEATADLQRMFGAGADERVNSPVGFTLSKRLPWLHINLLTAFLAASVVAAFESVIAKITVLAVFLPVVAGQGGNAGAQSLAVVMRGLVMREISPKNAKRFILKEAWVGVINGVVIGVVTAAVAWLWKGNPWLGLVIGLGMLVNLAVAGFSGAAIPIVMKSMRLDPAQSSNIILTTVTDVVGFFSFLGFAVLFQNYLI